MSRLSRVDFSRPPRAPVAGLAVLAVGAGLLAAALWWDHSVQRQQDERDRQSAQQAQALRARRLAVRPAEPTLAERRALLARQAAARPWLAAMRAVESAAGDPIYLLAWTFDRSSGQLKLEGEAPSFEHALAYTLRLEGEGPLKDATLLSHEQGVDNGGRPVVRFSVQVRWSPP